MPTTTTVQRIFNFSAGPAVLPQSVLEEAQRDLVSLPGVGMSILEISHRSKAFDAIIQGAEADIRALAGIPDDYAVLFLQGGASLQFSMVPMNLLTEGASADYVVTGSWSQKAVKEAKRHGKVRIAATTENGNFVRVPAASEISWDANAAYVHVTSNNTIFGTQFQAMPDSGAVPLVCDASSDIFSRPIDVAKYGLIYAGAQKNLGPSGVTLVIMRKELLKRSPASLPTMLNYGTHAENDSTVQHAAVLRHLHPRPRGQVAEGAGRPRGDRDDQRAEGVEALRRDRSDRLLPRPRRAGVALAHERHLPAAVGGAERPSSPRRRPPPASTA